MRAEVLFAEFESFEFEILHEFESTSDIMNILYIHRVDSELIYFLYQTYFVLSTSTAEVDRESSRMSRIKSSEKNKLGYNLLHCLFVSSS